MLQPLHQQQGQEAEVGLRLQPVPGAGLVVEVHLVLLQHGQLGLQPLGRLHPRLLDRVLLDEAGVDLVSGVQRQPLLVGHRLEVIVRGQLVGDLRIHREIEFNTTHSTFLSFHLIFSEILIPDPITEDVIKPLIIHTGEGGGAGLDQGVCLGLGSRFSYVEIS